MESKLVELISEQAIKERISEIAEKVNETFGDEEVVVVAVLAGSILFASDLVKRLKMPVQLEFVRLSSYGEDTKSSGKVKPVDLTLPSLEGKNVLIVEDIVDSGLTAKFIIDYIKLQHKAAKIRFATLLDKTCARKEHVQIDFSGFVVDEKFVVGYGMDYKGYYRNLPYIGYFPQ
ncbi:MAG: hypoxanthine phosphoribosyltransferase [Candidatus Melainabacteria bacterium GWF2_37_15]|nr:MAG: hypoxanthine phosphoribosyltransferase [Candidatus Melainabacteria bacterium GWF2_37_15]